MRWLSASSRGRTHRRLVYCLLATNGTRNTINVLTTSGLLLSTTDEFFPPLDSRTWKGANVAPTCWSALTTSINKYDTIHSGTIVAGHHIRFRLVYPIRTGLLAASWWFSSLTERGLGTVEATGRQCRKVLTKKLSGGRMTFKHSLRGIVDLAVGHIPSPTFHCSRP